MIGSRRASWRVISSIEQKGDADKLTLIQSYKRKIESELEDICSDILGMQYTLTAASKYTLCLFYSFFFKIYHNLCIFFFRNH